MARFDFFAAAEAVATQLRADAGIVARGAKVLVEEDVNFMDGQVIVIRSPSFTAPDGMQTLSNNTRLRMQVNMELYCLAFSGQLPAARELRNDLVGDVILALMTDATFGLASVASSWITGAQFEAGAAGQNKLYALGVLNLTLDGSSVR